MFGSDWMEGERDCESFIPHQGQALRKLVLERHTAELLGRVGLGTSDAFISARRFDSLNVNGIALTPTQKKAASLDLGSNRWRPGGHCEQGSPLVP
jgi:hypothetical protein